MFTKKRIIFIIILAVAGILAWFAPCVIKYRRTATAAGGFPHQVGLTKVTLEKCILDPDTGTCPNHNLCLSAPGECATYTAVDGTPAGGMGSQVLLLDSTISQIGLANGLSYIGGGTSPILMKVSASVGGVSYAVADKVNRSLNFFSYIIAGFKD